MALRAPCGPRLPRRGSVLASACCQVAPSLQTGNDRKVGAAALAFAAGLERGIDVRIQGRDCALGQHADYRVRLALEQDGLPQQVAVGAEGVAPEAVAENALLGPCGRSSVSVKLRPATG